jgi:uracil-DNA glycosylase family 4
MRETPEQLLQAIAAQVRVCIDCPLSRTRLNAVPGEGPPGAPVAFIGEAPGAAEDQQGRPFVGRSGQLLRTTIRELGWREDQVFIGNVLKCRPPENRDPQDSEIAACRHYLMAQLVLLRPRVVVTLGRFSMHLLISPKLVMGSAHGQHMLRDGQLYLPTYHPSAILRNNNLLPEFRRDLAKARKLSELPPE